MGWPKPPEMQLDEQLSQWEEVLCALDEGDSLPFAEQDRRDHARAIALWKARLARFGYTGSTSYSQKLEIHLRKLANRTAFYSLLAEGRGVSA